MRRLSAGLVLTVLLLAAGGALALAPSLRPSVVVDAEVIRLGDLFDNLGETTDVPVAPAPAPGRRAVYDADWLGAVARTYRLPWRPTSRFDRVVVERASQSVGPNEIQRAIQAALVEEGVPSDAEIELDNRLMTLHAPTGVPMRVTVPDLWFDRGTNRFTAMLVIPGDERPIAEAKVTGRIHEVMQIPVLKRQVMPGQVIRADDIGWVEVRADAVNRHVLSTADGLVGKTPRRPVQADKPLRARNFQDPVVVGRGSLVTIVLRTKAMVLTARGKAMEDGGQGDVIRVMNTQSRNVIDAEVTGPTTVAVKPATTTARR